MLHAIVGLGSNVGDRAETLRAAVRRLSAVTKIERLSRIYETAPLGGPEGQGAYLNAAVSLRYAGSPEELLDLLQGIEAALGRVRVERWGARTIDLDILWIDGVSMESERLTVPHPRLTERPFALRPLLDVDADAIDPWSALPYARLVDEATAHLVPTKIDLAGAS